MAGIDEVLERLLTDAQFARNFCQGIAIRDMCLVDPMRACLGRHSVRQEFRQT